MPCLLAWGSPCFLKVWCYLSIFCPGDLEDARSARKGQIASVKMANGEMPGPPPTSSRIVLKMHIKGQEAFSFPDAPLLLRSLGLSRWIPHYYLTPKVSLGGRRDLLPATATREGSASSLVMANLRGSQLQTLHPPRSPSTGSWRDTPLPFHRCRN